MLNNTLKIYIMKQAEKLHLKMHKHGKQWIVVPAVAIALMGGGLFTANMYHTLHEHNLTASANDDNGGEAVSKPISFDKWEAKQKQHHQSTPSFVINKQSGPVHIIQGNPVKSNGAPWKLSRHDEIEYSNAAGKMLPLSDQMALHDSGYQLGPAYTFLLGNKLNKQPKGITVEWPKAVTYNGQTLGVRMYIPSDSWAGNNYHSPTGAPYVSNIYGYKAANMIQVANNFYNGIRYSGFEKAQAQFTFYKNNDFGNNNAIQQIPGALISFDSLNGMASTQAKADEWPGSLVSGPMFDDPDNKEPLTGEFTNYATEATDWGAHGLIESHPKSNIRRYRSSLFDDDYVTGGYVDRQFYDWNRNPYASKHNLREFYKNSITYVAEHGNTQIFNFGSGDGYAWWKLSSHDFGTPPKPKLKKSTTQKDSPESKKTKSGKDHVLYLNKTKRYEYTIQGRVPTSGHKYSLIDRVPGQAKVTRVHFGDDSHSDQPSDKSGSSLQGVTPTSNGNTVSMNLGPSQISSNSGKRYTITVDAYVNEPEVKKTHKNKFTNTVTTTVDGKNPEHSSATDEIKNPKPIIPTPTKTTTNNPAGDNETSADNDNESNHLNDNGSTDYVYYIHGQFPKNITTSSDKDYYNLSDNLPSDVTPDGSATVTVDSHDENDLTKGSADSPEMHLDGSQLYNDQGRKYTLAIPVKDNYESDDSTSENSIVHHIHNQANVTTKINNGNPIHQPTNPVVNWYLTSGHPKPKIPSNHLLKTNTHPILSHPGEKYTYDITTPDGVPNREKYDKQGLDSVSGNDWGLFKTFIDDGSSFVDEPPINTYRNAPSAYPSSGMGETGHFDPQYEHEYHHEPNPHDKNAPTQYNDAYALDWPAYNDADVFDFQDKTPAWWDETNYGEPATSHTETDKTGYDRNGNPTYSSKQVSDNNAAPGGTFNVYHPYTPSLYMHAQDDYPEDNYTVTDQIPGEDTIDSAKLIDTTTGKAIDTDHGGDVSILQGEDVLDQAATNLPWEENGNYHNLIGFSLTPYQMAEYSTDHLDLKIHVKANHLNAPHHSGWHEIGNKTYSPADDYTEDGRHNNSDVGNEAYMSDEVMGQDNYAHTQRVYNKIKVVHYYNHWYDYNMHNDKDYVPAQQAEHSGYNDQFNRNWQGDPDSTDNANDLNKLLTKKPSSEWVKPMDKTQADDPKHGTDIDPTHDYTQIQAGEGLAYFGSHLKIPVRFTKKNPETGKVPFTRKDPVTGDTDKYRFGYDEAKKYEYTTVGANPNHYGDDSWVHAHQNDSRPLQGRNGGNDIPTIDDGTFDEAYYKPYMVPKVTTSPNMNRFIVDTDKKENGLPFRLDLDLNSYRNVLFNNKNTMQGWRNDFKGYKMHIRITDKRNGAVLYDNHDDENLEDALKMGYQRHSIFEKKGVLNTNDDSAVQSGKAGYGASVPLHVSVTYDDTDNRGAEIDPLFMTSTGYIADQYNFTNESFNQGKFALHASPERTIEYGGSNASYPVSENGNNVNHRIQYEEMVLNQDHTRPATFTTGYGLRSDLGPVTYYGLIGNDAGSAVAHNNQYDNEHYESWADGDLDNTSSRYQSELENGTKMDFAFPKEFHKDTNIDYDDNLPYGADSGQRSNMYSANLDDRLELANTHFDMKPFETSTDQDENMLHDKEGNPLDTLEDSSNRNKDESIDDFFDNGKPNDNQGTYTLENGTDSSSDGNDDATLQNEKVPEDLQSGDYSTDYKFYPRKIYRNSGHTALDVHEPLAFNIHVNENRSNPADFGTDGMAPEDNGVINKLNGQAINRLFTPYWLTLSTGHNSQNKNYNTVFEKARPSYDDASGDKQTSSMTGNDERLGGNFFNIEDSRADEAVGHMMVADNAPHDGQRSSSQLESDQMHSGESIQPVLGGHKSNNNPSEDTSDDDSSNHIGQNVSGFSKIANGWVRFVHNWRNLL